MQIGNTTSHDAISGPAAVILLSMYQAFKLCEHFGYGCSKAASAAPPIFVKVGGAIRELAPIVAREILKAYKKNYR